MKKYGKLIGFALILVVLAFISAVFPVRDFVSAFSGWIKELGPVGIALFIVVYAIATVLLVPGWILTITAGLLFGIVAGTAIALSGATLGAGLAFLVARHLVRDTVQKLAKSNLRFDAIDRAIGENGWKIVGLLRLSPLIPFSISNYLYGITAIRFWPYLLVSTIGMMPGALLYAYLGAVDKASLDAKAPPTIWQHGLLGVGLVATIAVTILAGRIARSALKKSGATDGPGTNPHA